ncbi:MAG: TroA family protein [Candidatus Aquicultor sp.]
MIDIGGQSRFKREEVDAWMIKKGRKAGGDRVSALDVLKGDLDPLTKRIVFMGYFTSELEKQGASPVAAGNYAVELYTSGGYKSDTVDMIAPAEPTGTLLERMEFVREAGAWVNNEVGITAKIIAEDLDEARLQRVNQVDVNGLTVYILGIEDTVIDKLKNFVFDGESSAITWVQEVIELNVNQLDLDYLNEEAVKTGVSGPLKQLLIELRLEDEEEEGLE